MNRELEEYGADVHGVRQMIIYGLKGMASYARHAQLLGEWDDSIGAFTHEVLCRVVLALLILLIKSAGNLDQKCICLLLWRI